ncbi:MAG: amidohydrolase family protein [Myxococcota bacterium]
MSPSAITSTRVVLREGDRHVVKPACIMLNGARIAAVLPHDEAPADALDLGDRLVAPSFIDVHTHLCLHGLRGAPLEDASGTNVVEQVFFNFESRLTYDDVRAITRVGALECLLHGTGLVWDHYYHADAILDGLRDVGMAGVIAPALQDLFGPGVGGAEAALDLTVDRMTADLDHGLTTALGPHATDTVSDALWQTIAEAADTHQLPIHGHIAQSIEEVERAWARAETTPLGLLDRLGVLDAAPWWNLVHGLYLSDADLTRLDPKRHHLVWCRSSQLQFGFPAHAPVWEAAGLSWSVATDCAATNDGMNVQKELREVAGLRTSGMAWGEAHATWRRHASLPHAQAVAEKRRRGWYGRASLGDVHRLLDRVTTFPGRLHPLLPAGQIAPGYLANLTLFNMDHPSFWPGRDPIRALAMSDVSPAIWGMLVAGKWVSTPGAHAQSLIEDDRWTEARREASERLVRLLA